MKNFKKLAVLLCIASLLIFCAESLSAAEPKPRYGGTLRLSDAYDGISIGYPPKLIRANSNRQAAPAVETLFRTDKTGKPAPWLATGFTNHVGAKTITLTLRKGVKFHDGTDFNAEAVKWNLEQCMSARTPGTEKFRSIDVIDDYSIRINLTEWDSTITSNFAQTLGMMISPTACKKNGADWCANNPVGTGPFQFVSWEKEVRTKYKRFDNYWQKGKPYLDGIEWIPINDTLTRLLSLKKGELDLGLTISPKDIADLEKDGYIVVRQRAGAGARALAPDSANPNSPFANLKVRQAAQYAIDNEGIAKAIYYGEAEPANQWIYKGHWAYNSSVVGYPYNPTKAKQLLAEAGYPNGFKTKITYFTTPENDKLCTAVQGCLKAVGIDAELDPMQSTRYDQIALQGGKWEGLLWAGMMPNPDVIAALSSRYAGGG